MANETYDVIAARYMTAIQEGEKEISEVEQEIDVEYAGRLKVDIKRQLQRLMAPGQSIGSGTTRNRKTRSSWSRRSRSRH